MGCILKQAQFLLYLDLLLHVLSLTPVRIALAPLQRRAMPQALPTRVRPSLHPPKLPLLLVLLRLTTVLHNLLNPLYPLITRIPFTTLTHTEILPIVAMLIRTLLLLLPVVLPTRPTTPLTLVPNVVLVLSTSPLPTPILVSVETFDPAVASPKALLQLPIPNPVLIPRPAQLTPREQEFV